MELYNIPLFGEVHIEHDGPWQGDYDLGELIRNVRAREAETITVRAADDGLISDGIYPNDFLTVDMKRKPHDGDIAVVRLGHRVYARKIFFEKKFVRLETSGDNPAPLIIEPKTPGFELVGRVVTVIREL